MTGRTAIFAAHKKPTALRIEDTARRLGFRLELDRAGVRLRSHGLRAPAALAEAIDRFEPDLLAVLHDREMQIAERTAIGVHDGGVPEPWAAFLARLELEPPPPRWPPEHDWEVACGRFWRRVDLHGAALVACGWRPAAIWQRPPDGDDADLALWTGPGAAEGGACIHAIGSNAIFWINAAGRLWAAHSKPV
jgi:hypothetical protein